MNTALYSYVASNSIIASNTILVNILYCRYGMSRWSVVYCVSKPEVLRLRRRG